MTREETPPPGLKILEITYSNFVIARALYAFAKLGIADLLGEKTASSEELASNAGVDSRALYRLLRTLSTADVVAESSDHRFSLGPLGEALRSDAPGSMRAWAIFSGEPFYLQAWEQIVHSVQTGQPAWERVHKMPIFEYIGRHPDAGQIFDQAMTSLSAGEAPAIIEAYDFSGAGKLADIGGGQGLLLRTILESHPGMTGILFDRPEAVEGVDAQLRKDGLAERCEVVAGDFFQSVPSGADVYLLKYVIHDWDDERSLAILENCRRAMKNDAKLLLVETVVPSPGESHFAKLQDLEMMVIAGSQERTVDEYSRLLEQAGFRLARVVQTTEPASILEAVAR
jgi:SAM-dependent methyltransferase